MGTKRLLIALAAAALSLVASFPAIAAEATGTADAATIYRSTPTSNPLFNSNVLPVLVRVDRQGTITYVAPAFPLRSRYGDLLRQSLAAMITQPAHDKQGQPIASEFVIYLTGKTVKRDDGKYDFMFSYLSARPVPFGQWVWGQFASGELALLSPDMGWLRGRNHRNVNDGSCYYDGQYYASCELYCVELGPAVCKQHDQPKQDKPKDDKPDATGTQIAAASAGVYRLQRPSFAVRVRAANRGRMGIYHPVATRFQSPVTASDSSFPSSAQAPAAPVRSNFGGGFGATRVAPPEPASRGGRH